jgi:hypothetical protein
MNSAGVFMIYQLKKGDELRNYRFVPHDLLHQMGLSVEKKNYNLVYSAPLENDTTLDDIFARFNIDRPSDFRGHSLSVSDVVVMSRNGKVTAYFVDAVGFNEVSGF